MLGTFWAFFKKIRSHCLFDRQAPDVLAPFLDRDVDADLDVADSLDCSIILHLDSFPSSRSETRFVTSGPNPTKHGFPNFTHICKIFLQNCEK
jgi:hypothetical protein